MTYSIKEVAEKTGLSIATLRYYDKEGLLPFVDKNANGTRIFKDEDFQGLNIITCMKKSGMSIKEIKEYVDLCNKGDATLQDRLHIFYNRRESLLEQIDDLKATLATIEYKINYYETAISAGTEDLHRLYIQGKAKDMPLTEDCT
ncbi:MAG: MerR family transcriptional regulator [Clostridium sp.]